MAASQSWNDRDRWARIRVTSGTSERQQSGQSWGLHSPGMTDRWVRIRVTSGTSARQQSGQSWGIHSPGMTETGG